MKENKVIGEKTPHCYGRMDWILKYPEGHVPDHSICKCEHKDRCMILTRNKTDLDGTEIYNVESGKTIGQVGGEL